MVQGQRRSSGLLVFVSALVAMALLAAGCNKGTDSSSGGPSNSAGTGGPSTVIPVDEGTPKNGGKLAFGVDAEPDTLNVINAQWAYNGHLIGSSMVETLTVFDENRVAKPYLA